MDICGSGTVATTSAQHIHNPQMMGPWLEHNSRHKLEIFSTNPGETLRIARSSVCCLSCPTNSSYATDSALECLCLVTYKTWLIAPICVLWSLWKTGFQMTNLISLEFVLVEEATGQKLLAEGDNVSRVVHAPVLMGPKLPCGPSTSLDLIHVESTAMLGR